MIDGSGANRHSHPIPWVVPWVKWSFNRMCRTQRENSTAWVLKPWLGAAREWKQTWTHIQWSWDLVGYSNTYHLTLEPQNAYEVQHRSGLPNPSRRPLEARSLETSRFRLQTPRRRKSLLLVFAQADQSSTNIHTRTSEESLATALEPAPRK